MNSLIYATEDKVDNVMRSFSLSAEDQKKYDDLLLTQNGLGLINVNKKERDSRGISHRYLSPG